jgi:archaellum component FlaC
MELTSQTEVKIIKLKTKDAANGYTGLTKVKAAKAVEAMDTLWRYYALLSDVVDKASDLYSKNSFLRNTEDEVKALLESTQITLETERVDISSRGLLSPENKNTRVNLQELLEYMRKDFETIRNTMNEISHTAETIENRLSSMQNEISSLNNTARQLWIPDMVSFDAAVVLKTESDPLQGLAELDTLSYKLEQYRNQISKAEDDYNKTADALNNAKAMLSEIEDTARKSESAILESQKIFSPAYSGRPPVSRIVYESLKDWLRTLENKLSEGGLNAAKIGAQRLEKECTSKLDIEKENIMTIASALRSIPKKPGQKINPLLEALRGD